MAKVINTTTKARPVLEATALKLARAMESGARQFMRAFQNDDGLVLFREASGVVTAILFPNVIGTTTGLLVPNPIPFRGINVETLPADAFNLPYWALTASTLSSSSSGGGTTVSVFIQTMTTTATLFSGQGGILQTISGTSRSTRVSVFAAVGDRDPISYTVSASFSNYYRPQDHDFVSGTSSSGVNEGGGYHEQSNLSTTSETSISAYQAALAAASSGGVKRSFARTSDGAVLVSVPHPPANLLHPSLSANWYVAPQAGSAVGVEQSTWTGDGYLDIYNYTAFDTGHMVAEHSFPVPEDCIYPLTKNVPPLPAGGDTEAWGTRWVGGYRAGQRHRIAWLKKSSDQTIEQLKNGTLPSGWATTIKRGLPASEHVRRDAPLSVIFSDDVVDQITPPGGPQPPGVRNRVVTRTVTMSYEPPADLADEPSREWTFTGTRTDTISDISKLVWTVTTVFSNWWDAKDLGNSTPVPGVANLESLLFADTQIVGDDTDNAAQFTIWNGTQQYTRLVDVNGGVDSVYATNSSVLNPNGALAFRRVAGIVPTDATNGVVGTVPEFINQYRTEYPLKYDASAETQGFVDSRINDKNVVSFTPVGLVTDEFSTDQKLGFLYHADDAQNAQKLEIWGTAYFVYSAIDGSLTFKSWVPAQTDTGADSIIIDIPPIYDSEGAQTASKAPEYNCIVRVDDVPWKDLITAEKSARNERAAGRGDQIMKAVLDSLQTR